MFFIGAASGIIFIIVFVLLIANRVKSKDNHYIITQLNIMERQLEILTERNKYESRIACALEKIAERAIRGIAGNNQSTQSNGISTKDLPPNFARVLIDDFDKIV